VKTANCYIQIKYEELPEFDEILAAGTAAALVPIKSLTRESTGKTSQYIPEDSEEPGPVFTKLITTLQGIQLGKIKDTFGWTVPVTEVDAAKYTPTEINGDKGNGIQKTINELP